MSVLDRPDNVPVPLGYCPCEGQPHADGDVVYLYPELSMAGGMAAQAALSDAMDDGFDQMRLQELLAKVWMRHCVAAWTFLDDLGKPIPVTPDNIALALPYGKGGRDVADKADNLYSRAVLAPLEERYAALSRTGRTRTPAPTSRAATTRRKRPSRSSTATTDKVPLDG